MGSKVIVFLGFFLLAAMVLLISSNQVGARDLAETSNAVDTSNEKTNGADVNVDGRGGYNKWGQGGGYGGELHGGGKGYGRGGGYKGGHGGSYGHGGGYKGGHGGGYKGGHGGGHGYCRHGYCHYRCCNYAGEKVDAAEP